MIEEKETVLVPLVCKPQVAQPNGGNMATSSRTQPLEDNGGRRKSEECGIVVLEDVERGNGVSKMRLLYKYAEGQYSPINPRGKKQYGREFLHQLQYSVLALQKPVGMPDIPDIVFDKPHRKPEKINQPGDVDFVPRYTWGVGLGGGGANMNKWVPRHVENNPKTMDQIHTEITQEAQDETLISQQNQMAARSHGRGIGGGQGQNGGSNDDRNNVSSNRTPIKSTDRSIDPPQLNPSKQNIDISAIKLGLGSGANRFAGWGRDSALNTTGIPLRWKEKTSPKANTDIGNNLSSQEPNTSTTWIKMLDEINTERKTKEILNDYFAGQDFEKAVKFVKELPSQNHHHFVCFAFRIVQDRTSSDRKQTGLLFHDLIEHNVIHVNSFIKGLEEVLNHAAYLKIDNPIWQFYGELISPLIQDGTVPLRSIKLAADPLIARTKEVDVLDEITGGAVKRERIYEECLKHFMTT